MSGHDSTSCCSFYSTTEGAFSLSVFEGAVQYYWFCYLGNNEYRITKLSSGLSLQPKDDKLIQIYDENCTEQRWIIKKAADGTYQIVNKSTDKAICDRGGSDKTITLAAQSSTKTQQWKIEPVANRTFG